MNGPGIQVELMLHPSQVAVVDVLADCLVVRVLDRCGRLGQPHTFITPSAAADFLLNDRGTGMSDTNDSKVAEVSEVHFCIDCYHHHYMGPLTSGSDEQAHLCVANEFRNVVTRKSRPCLEVRMGAKTCSAFRASVHRKS